MNRDSRIKILTKIAKKTKEEHLSGQHNRKSVEKHLNKVKDVYFSVSSKLKQLSAEVDRLQKIMDELSGTQSYSKKQMKKCQEILSCMDMNRNVDKVSLKDDAVYYLVNGKLCTYEAEKDEFVPRKRGKGKTEESDESEDLEEDDNDLDLDEGYSVNRADQHSSIDFNSGSDRFGWR